MADKGYSLEDLVISGTFESRGNSIVTGSYKDTRTITSSQTATQSEYRRNVQGLEPIVVYDPTDNSIQSTAPSSSSWPSLPDPVSTTMTCSCWLPSRNKQLSGFFTFSIDTNIFENLKNATVYASLAAVTSEQSIEITNFLLGGTSFNKSASLSDLTYTTKQLDNNKTNIIIPYSFTIEIPSITKYIGSKSVSITDFGATSIESQSWSAGSWGSSTATQYMFNGEQYSAIKRTRTWTCSRSVSRTGTKISLSSAYSETPTYQATFSNLSLWVEYEDVPIKISATPNSSIQSSDTPVTFLVSSTDSTKTLKDCYFTASFTHERSGVSKVFHSEPEFKVSNLNQIYPYIQGSENYNGAIQNLFLYIPDIWERNTANEIIFAEGDIYTVTLTATRYTIDDTVITNPVTENFVYTIGSVTKLTLNSINSTLTDTSSVANDALLEFSLYGTLGTYAVETISWTGELQKVDGTKICTLEYSGYEKTSIETGTNVKLGTGKYRIPSNYRSQVLSGGPYKIYITATATTYDNTTIGPIDNTFENWIFVPSEYTLSLKSGLNEGQEVYAGQEITSLFALSKTGEDQAETGVQYTFKIKINNTNYLEITTFDTAYTWYCDDILGPVTYEISCEANIGGQGPQTETVNCTTYARLMQSSAIVTDKNEYYNTESAIITSKITIPAPALTKEVILSVKDKEELTRYTIPVQDSSYTASQLKFTLNFARELYLKYRGPIQITLAAIARDGINSAYVKTEYSTVSKTIYIINSAGKFIYPVEGATTVIPHPDFMIQSEKGTFATGYGFVSLGDGKWIRVTLEADAKDNTKYRFKQPYVIANNTDYTLQFKETLELDKYSEVLSSQIAVSWKTNFVDLNFVTEGNYRLLEKYNYRKYLINLLNWYGALSDDLNNIEKTTNKSQLSKLIDVVTTLFGDKQVYSTIASALEKYGNDSPQTWNAFIAAQLYNARQYKN